MDKVKQKYVPPVITRVKFEDKELVSFNVCKKITNIELDLTSCCQVLQPFKSTNLNSFDPS
jgi:hypothetical protein